MASDNLRCPVIDEVLPEGVCCCFTGTTLFTTMFTILVCSLNSMIVYTKSIGGCVSKLLCSSLSLW